MNTSSCSTVMCPGFTNPAIPGADILIISFVAFVIAVFFIDLLNQERKRR